MRKEFITFRLGPEEYGVPILNVQEIRSYEKPTRISNAPDIIKGVINLRGVVIPIIDLRIKLNCPEVEYNEFTCVILINVNNRTVGIVVDTVSDVVKLYSGDIKPAPPLTTSIHAQFINGIGCTSNNGLNRMIILLDIIPMMSEFAEQNQPRRLLN